MIDSVNNYKDYLTKKGKSKNTIYAYITDIGLYLKFLTRKEIDLYKSNNQTITLYIQNLVDQGKSKKSISRNIVSLRKFFSYLKDEKLIKEIPKIEYKNSKNKTLPQILTIEEVDTIINITEKNCFKGIRDNALLELMYATGMKVTELINLGVENVNLDSNYIKCIDGNHSERIIPIGKSAHNSLIQYFKIRRRITQGEISNLFVNLSGNKLTRQGVWGIVKEYSKKAGIDKDISLNTFRHSFAVHLLQNGANARVVQKLLGNQVMTYMDTYYEIINNDKINYTYIHTHPRA